ncbi:MAG: alpha/beta hydrolase family protein [Bacillota bacterium]
MLHRLPYGSTEWQFGELRLPEGAGPHPAVIVIHGGGWQASTDLAYMRPAALHLTRRGLATWTIEYRRMGNPGGGWPGTLDDILQATDYLLEEAAPAHGIDPRRVVALGHSSGGQLAAWLGVQRPVLAGVVSLAGVLDMAAQYRLRRELGASNYVADLLGGSPEEVPARYAAASPTRLPPPAMPVVLVHGENDWRVPPSHSQTYHAYLQAQGGQVELIQLPGVDHVEIFNSRLPGWEQIASAVERLVVV